MAIEMEFSLTPEQRVNMAAWIEHIFGIPEAGRKVTQTGWRIDQTGLGDATLRVELVRTITREQADAFVRGEPVFDIPDLDAI